MNTIKILWADDDPDDIAMMQEVLYSLNCAITVKEVRNGQEALDYLQESKQSNTLPSLIMLDMNMPVRNGRETLMQLKQDACFKNIPTAIVTTSNSLLDQLFC
jgi:CheY-like chemotaxis protein